MAIKTKDGWKCFYCKKVYTHPEKADKCREEHQLVYVPISVTDLSKLLNYIFISDMEILEDTQVVRTLQEALTKKNLDMIKEQNDKKKTYR